MWCQEFDIYIDINITLSISDLDFLYQFNLRLHHFWGVFLMLKKRNIFQKLAGLWLVGEVVDHVGLYKSWWPRVARRSNVGLVIYRNLLFYMYVNTHERICPDTILVYITQQNRPKGDWVLWIFDNIIVDVIWGFEFPVGTETAISSCIRLLRAQL